jgi:hypothetical protein
MNWLETILAIGAVYLGIGLVLSIVVLAGVVVVFVKVWRGMSKADKRFDEMHDRLWKNR